jgi:hypothetical protein
MKVSVERKRSTGVIGFHKRGLVCGLASFHMHPQLVQCGVLLKASRVPHAPTAVQCGVLLKAC